MNAYDGLLAAIKDDPDLPEQVKRLSCALVLAIADISADIKRIADTLEKRPSAVTNVYAPNLREADVKFRAQSPDGKIKSEAVIPRAATSWIAWHGHHIRPWKNLDPRSTVRVQFRSKPDHIETYRLDSSEIDWSDVIAYQIVNRSE